MKRFLFLNDTRQLLAFSTHRSGTNLPGGPHEWRLVDDNGYLHVIYDWEPDKLKDMADGLRKTGFFVFAAKRAIQPKRRLAPLPAEAIEVRA